MKKILVGCLSFSFLILVSCSAHKMSYLKTSKMDKLELGMSKVQVSSILGTKYTIAKKEIAKEDTIEVLSYRNYPYEDEVYLFQFRNNQLEKWEREFIPKYKEIK